MFINAQTWYRQNPKLSTHTLYDIDNNGNHFMAVGELGTIISSLDAGDTWSTINPYPDQDLNGIKVLSSTTMIAVGNQGTILRSTNKGISWTKISAPTSKNLNKVHFLNSELGLIVGSDGVILRSTNGGFSWTAVNSGVTHHLNNVFFLDSNRAYAVGNNGTFLRSTDGGINWSKINLSTTTNLTGVFFTSWDIGYLIGSYTFMRTVNGGDNWERKAGGSEFNQSIKFKNPNEGYIASGPFGRFYKCTNPLVDFRNIGWAEVNSSDDSNDRLNGLAFHNDVIISVGSFGIILKSTDSGKTWEQKDRGHVKAVLSLEFFDENFGIAVGEESLLTTQDGGKNWTSNKTFEDWFEDSEILLTNMQFLNRNTIYVTGQYGNLIKSKDGGLSWADIESNVSNRWVTGCHFFDEMKGIIIGDEVLKRTINGGTSWLPINLPDNVTDYFWDIHFLNADKGFLSGGNGALYRTLTAGVTWERVPLPTISDIYKIHFYDQNTGFVVGSKGVMHKTVNGGTTWSSVSISGASDFWDVHVLSQNTVYATSPTDGLYKSTDGGVSWTLDKAQKGVFGIEFTSQGTGYIGGLLGMIKTSNQLLTSTQEEEMQFANKVLVYPNPTDGILNIDVINGVQIQIYNVAGVELARFEAMHESIDISSFESGVYFLKIFNSEGSFSVKKIIKH